jgi:hypothetical protein
MPIFYLQFGNTEDAKEYRKQTETYPIERYFLDNRLHATAEKIQEIEAQDWLEARALVPDFI